MSDQFYDFLTNGCHVGFVWLAGIFNFDEMHIR